MPEFEIMSVDEARARSAAGRRAKTIQQYREYITEVRATGKAGRLTPEEGETATAIRRRLGVAADAMGINLEIKRVGDEVFFWVRPLEAARKSGRSKKGGHLGT